MDKIVYTDRQTNEHTEKFFLKGGGGFRIQRMGFWVEMKMFGNYKPTKKKFYNCFVSSHFFQGRLPQFELVEPLILSILKKKSQRV